MNMDYILYKGLDSDDLTNVQLFDSGWGNEKYYYDKNGNMFHVPRRNKFSHPYSYDPILLFDSGEEPTGGAYSDRMYQWNGDKFRDTMAKHNGGKGEMGFNWSNKSRVEKFCQEYFDDPTMKIISVLEQCNISNGYPVWYISWSSTKAKA